MIRLDHRSRASTTSKDRDGKEDLLKRSKSRQRRRSASWDVYMKEGSTRAELKRDAMQTEYRNNKAKYPVSKSSKERLASSPIYEKESKHEKNIKNDNTKESKEDAYQAISGGRLNGSKLYHDDDEKKKGWIRGTKSTSSVKTIVQRFNHKGMEKTSVRTQNVRESTGRIPKSALSTNVLSQIKSKRQDYDNVENIKPPSRSDDHGTAHLASSTPTTPREPPKNTTLIGSRHKAMKTSVESTEPRPNLTKLGWNCDECGNAHDARRPFCVVCGAKSRSGTHDEMGEPKSSNEDPRNNQNASSGEFSDKPKLVMQSLTTNPEAWRCGSCGNVNENGRKSCMNCGNDNMIPVKTTMSSTVFSSRQPIKGPSEDVTTVASEAGASASSYLRKPRMISPISIGNETGGHTRNLSYSRQEEYPRTIRNHSDVNVVPQTTIPQPSNFYTGKQAWKDIESDQHQSSSIHSVHATPDSWECNYCKLNNTSSGPFCCHCGQNRNNNVTTVAFTKQRELARYNDDNNSMSPRKDYLQYTPRDVIQHTAWKCRCLHINDEKRKFCERCGGANPAVKFNQTPAVIDNEVFVTPLLQQNSAWQCSSCFNLNEFQAPRCHFCGETKATMANYDSISITSSIQSSSRSQQFIRPEYGKKEWACKSCYNYNLSNSGFCSQCGAKRILDDDKDLRNLGINGSMERRGDNGYFNRPEVIPLRTHVSDPSGSVEEYIPQEVRIDRAHERFQNSNFQRKYPNNRPSDLQQETQQQQTDSRQNHVNTGDYGNVHKNETHSVHSVDEPHIRNNTMISSLKNRGEENRGSLMPVTTSKSRTFTPNNNPCTTPNSQIPKSALSLSVLADISSGKATLKKAPKESKKEEATNLLSQIKQGKNLKSVKERMSDDRTPQKNARPMTILDQIKSGPKLKKVDKTHATPVSSREVDNLSALGSIFARRKILVGSKQDSARSDFDSDEWS